MIIIAGSYDVLRQSRNIHMQIVVQDYTIAKSKIAKIRFVWFDCEVNKKKHKYHKK